MEKQITKESLRNFAYCNINVCKKPLVGVAVSFFGLGGSASVIHHDDSPDGVRWGEQGVLYVQPYHNPWAWMNRQTVAFVDEILDVVFAMYDLPEDFPIVYYGSSMGGQSALVYTAYAKRSPVACVVDCPVCDLLFHYSERPDLPRTLYSAFGTYEGSLQAALATASPLHLIDKMPKSTQYVVYHGEQDPMVHKQTHSDRFVQAMQASHRIEYHTIPDGGHCDMPPEWRKGYHDCIVQHLLAAKNK